METIEFSRWCQKATWRIGFPPDRKRVRQEYFNHMTDHYDALIEAGVDRLEARRLVLESMGDPEELAPLLAAIHRPFWGYFLRVSRIVAIVLLCISLLPIYRYVKHLHTLELAPVYLDFDVYNSNSYGGNTGRTLHHLSHPDVSVSSDGNRFVITDVALITRPLTDNIGDQTTLNIRMHQTTLLPWSVQQQYFTFYSVASHFFARDSLGNIYPAQIHILEADSVLHTRSDQSGLFTCTHHLWIKNFPVDARWVDICYERDGRSFSLRIDLTGGAGV